MVQLDIVHFDKDDAYIMMDFDPENPCCRKELKKQNITSINGIGGWWVVKHWEFLLAAKKQARD